MPLFIVTFTTSPAITLFGTFTAIVVLSRSLSPSLLSDLVKDTLPSPSSTNLTAISFMPAIVTLLEPLACWILPSLSTISAVTLVSSPVAVLIPEILKLLPSVSVFISLPALSFTKNLPFASLPTVYSFVLGVSFGSFMVTVSLSPLTAFLGSLIVTVVLLRSPSLTACSLVIVLAP